MKEMRGFELLAKTLMDLSDECASSNLSYLNGKAYAFAMAAKWLREEIEFYEKESW
jgi:hypothetical protein